MLALGGRVAGVCSIFALVGNLPTVTPSYYGPQDPRRRRSCHLFSLFPRLNFSRASFAAPKGRNAGLKCIRSALPACLRFLCSLSPSSPIPPLLHLSRLCFRRSQPFGVSAVSSVGNAFGIHSECVSAWCVSLSVFGLLVFFPSFVLSFFLSFLLACLLVCLCVLVYLFVSFFVCVD